MPEPKIERDEIDENDWVQIQTVIEEALQNILNFRKMKESLLKRISIANWQYSSIHDRRHLIQNAFNKRPFANTISELKVMKIVLSKN
jgi:hypothetical protein